MLFVSFKLIANLKMLSENLLRIPFSVIGRCSPVWAIGCRENASNSVVTSDFRYFFLQNHRRLPVCVSRVKIAALESLKRVIESIFKIS